MYSQNGVSQRPIDLAVAAASGGGGEAGITEEDLDDAIEAEASARTAAITDGVNAAKALAVYPNDNSVGGLNWRNTSMDASCTIDLVQGGGIGFTTPPVGTDPWHITALGLYMDAGGMPWNNPGMAPAAINAFLAANGVKNITAQSGGFGGAASGFVPAAGTMKSAVDAVPGSAYAYTDSRFPRFRATIEAASDNVAVPTGGGPGLAGKPTIIQKVTPVDATATDFTAEIDGSGMLVVTANALATADVDLDVFVDLR